jgi:hypothetical protein
LKHRDKIGELAISELIMSQASPQRLQMIARYQKGDRDLRGMDLRGVDLSGVKLFQVDLREASLFGANLAGADLRQVNFGQANLSQANLENADLQGADFAGANLRRANLMGADIRNARLQAANLTGAKMPDGRLFAGQAIADAEPLQAAEIQRDLQKVAPPKPEPKVILPPIVRSFAQVKADLPYTPLFSLGAGFFLMGLQLATVQAAAYFYLLPLLMLLMFYFSPQWAGLVPIAILLLLILSMGKTGLIALIFPGLIFCGVLAGLLWMGRDVSSRPLRDTLWISVVFFVGLILYCFLLFAPVIALIIVATIVTTGFGCLTPSDMISRRFQPREILWATQLIAIVGLLIGGTIGALIPYPIS